MKENCNECGEMFVRKNDIDRYITKKDVVLVLMKNGKVWVCSKTTDLTQNSEFIKIVLASKGKCE